MLTYHQNTPYALRHAPETWDHFTKCPLAKDGVHLTTWKPEDTIMQHARGGLATPPANEVHRLMGKPEIKKAVLRGALEIYRVIADNAPDNKATVRHMQLTAIKRADAQPQHYTPL